MCLKNTTSCVNLVVKEARPKGKVEKQSVGVIVSNTIGCNISRSKSARNHLLDFTWVDRQFF